MTGLAGCLCTIVCASQTDAGPARLQDFLKEVDLQFLDHMRRGTSINFADLASDPPPATMQAGRSLSSHSVLQIPVSMAVHHSLGEHCSGQTRACTGVAATLQVSSGGAGWRPEAS